MDPLHPFLSIVLPRMGIAANHRILDLGCGDGWASRAMATLAGAGMVVGIDSNGERIREARRHSAAFENILYVEADAEENPWQDGFFSHAVLIDSIYHVRDAEATLRHLHRVLSPGGQLWMVNQMARANDAPEPPEADTPPAAILRAEQYIEMLVRCGLEATQAETITTAPASPASFLITARKPAQG